MEKLTDNVDKFDIAVFLMSCIMGTYGWLCVLLFFTLGTGLVFLLGLNVPLWVSSFSLIGLPLGAWFELRRA